MLVAWLKRAIKAVQYMKKIESFAKMVEPLERREERVTQRQKWNCIAEICTVKGGE